MKAAILLKWADEQMVRGKIEENMLLMLLLHLMNVFVTVGPGLKPFEFRLSLFKYALRPIGIRQLADGSMD